MGIDPGFRTGCKVATVDPTGKLLHTVTIYPHEPRNERAKSLQALAGLAELDKISVIAIGNGTASRETEGLAVELIQTFRASQTLKVSHLAYVMVSEAGASVYSASDISCGRSSPTSTFPCARDSIARRLQDPLAESGQDRRQEHRRGALSARRGPEKTDRHARRGGRVGGQLRRRGCQHRLGRAAGGHVAGISKKVAGAIVAHRDENGPFGSRAELKKVKGLGPKAFEQAARFLRVPGSKNPLDNTTIHPESYDATKQLLELADLNLRMADLPNRLRAWCEGNGLATGAGQPDERRPTKDEWRIANDAPRPDGQLAHHRDAPRHRRTRRCATSWRRCCGPAATRARTYRR